MNEISVTGGFLFMEGCKGGPSGRGTQFVDIKLKVPSHCKLLLLQCQQ